MFDLHRRPLRNLRLSVTDRCNLRCSYCMPEEEYRWLPRERVLRFEETSRLVDLFLRAGVDKLRITGGEPLLRKDLTTLLRMLAGKPGVRELAMTTNGVLLAEHAADLRGSGLHRLTVSLDTLDPATFRLLARRDDLSRVLAGIDAATAAGFAGTKLDTVVIAGVNDREVARLFAFARERGLEIRFIEYMDVGGATQWRPERVVPRAQIVAAIQREFGTVTPVARTDSAPAERFTTPDGTTFGVISSMTQPFCGTCDRARLTADGMWFLCLYALRGYDLGELVRSGVADDLILARIRAVWSGRDDRGAERRAADSTAERRPLAEPGHLRDNPHLEMHTRGG
ncbi:MAG: GTP 3',8-cyclase MoaA [Planctomycetota bacterium]